MPQSTDTGPMPPAAQLAAQLLEQYDNAETDTSDPGIPVLASVASTVGGPQAAACAQRAVARWARTIGKGPSHAGLFDQGLSGTLAGLLAGARVHPDLRRAADRLRDHLTATAQQRPWRTHLVGLEDYDLIRGPAGAVLALCTDDTCEPHHLLAYADHLTQLCDNDELSRLRTGQYRDHPHLAMMHGRINTGMGHGVAGLTAALTAVVRRTGRRPELTTTLDRTTRWLMRHSFEDDRSVRSWDGTGLGGPPPAGARARQAWCYGNPGVTWALWDASDAIGDQPTADWAARAFTTLAEHYDENFHLYGPRAEDRLGLCHGTAGVLAVADAFARHAKLPAAAHLRNRLVRHLHRHLSQISDLAPRQPQLLTGATGMLSALLTAVYDGPRTWLPCLGLR